MNNLYIYDICETFLTNSSTKSEILLFCKDERGKDVCVRVPDTKFYLFCELQEGDDYHDLIEDINAVYINKKCNRTHCCNNSNQFVLNLSPCGKHLERDKSLAKPVIGGKITWKKSCFMYSEEYKKMVQLELARPFLSPSIANYLIKKGKTVYESYPDAAYAFNYSYDKKREICTGSILDETKLTAVINKKTTCEKEYLCIYDKLPLLENNDVIPPFLGLGIDIETSVKDKNVFPTAEKDEIFLITIGDVTFTWMPHFKEEDKIKVFKTEAQMLCAFVCYLKEVKPNALYGYCSNKFDWPYLKKRCDKLNVRFDISKLKEEEPIIFNALRSSKGKGTNLKAFIHCPGMLFVDVLEYIIESPMENFTSYKLEHTAPIILKDNNLCKHKFELNESNPIFYGKDLEKKKKYIEYNRMDALLPLLIANKCNILKNILIEAKIVGMSARHLLVAGRQEQSISLSRRFFYNENYLVPVKHVFPLELPELRDVQGASVIEPVAAFYYDDLISNLDVNSMYPSIIQSANLSFDTLIVDKTHEDGYDFVPKEKHKGLIPRMTELLIKERNAVKHLMKTEKNKEIKELLDIKQNKLKLKANSIYGVMNSPGKFNCPYVAARTTKIGRKCFEILKQFMIEKGLHIIYGDTDSIFYKSLLKTIKEALKEGQDLANEINMRRILPDGVLIAHEYIRRRFLIFAKKKYISINYKYENDDGDLKQKGTAAVKSDNAPFMSKLFKELTHKVMIEELDKNGVELFIREALFNLWNRDDSISIADLTISKKYSKPYASYKDASNQEHLQVIKHWEAWDLTSAPRVGDKVPYVIVNLQSNTAKVSERCYPPFMISSIKEIDVFFLVESKLKQPLSSFLKILGFDGEEIRNIFDPPLLVSKNKEEWHRFGEGPMLLPRNQICDTYLNLRNKKTKNI